MHSEVVVLGIDELACRAGLPHPVLQIALQLLSALGVISRKHGVRLGAAICYCISFCMTLARHSVHHHKPCLRCCREWCFAFVLPRFWYVTALQDRIKAK